jgi:endonuclease/exonuclease/phosphatase family metal-dependent hydrolase
MHHRAMRLLGVLAVFYAALQLVECRADAADETAQAFRVMTFNIRYDNPGDGENGWVHRKDKVASVIRLHQADIAGLQEALKHQIDELAERLPEYAWFGVGRQDGKVGGEFTPIFYRRDRLEVVEKGDFWLSETPEKIGSKSWDAALPRIATWGKFKDKKSEEQFFLLNTHFDHVGLTARLESAKRLRSWAESRVKELPVIVIGDFNCLPTSPPIQWLTCARVVTNTIDGDAAVKPVVASCSDCLLCDAIERTKKPHHGPTSTWNGFGPLVPLRKIDHIFVTERVDVLQHAILADHWDSRWPSDHLPVLAEVELRSSK